MIDHYQVCVCVYIIISILQYIAEYVIKIDQLKQNIANIYDYICIHLMMVDHDQNM
jgi:hypothetical protein